MTLPLLDKSDGFEIVRDKISEILAAETVLQQALAVSESEDPIDYTFYVYKERIRPWEAFTSRMVDGIETVDETPIVNVWYSGGVSDETKSSDVTGQQRWTSRYNIDVYCYSSSEETTEGHTPGDQAVALKAHRFAMLVRNILMHDDNKILKLSKASGVRVWKRWVSDINPFQQQSGGQIVENVLALRVELKVEHEEYILQADEEICEAVDIVFKHEPSGMVIASITVGTPAPAPEEPPEEPGD